MKKNSRIIVIGCRNVATLALLQKLRQGSFSEVSFLCPDTDELTDIRRVEAFFKKIGPEYCFLMHLREGGIRANTEYPAELIYENIVIQTNVIHCAWQAKVKKLFFLASSCVYPKDYSGSIREEDLLSGPIESTSESYAAAKIAGIKMCQAYNRQFGTSFTSLVPATAFGQDGDFDAETAHVIPALIRKFCEAKIKNIPEVTVWGTGKPRREFIYAQDLAEAILFLTKQKNHFEIINIGTGIDISIRDLAKAIQEIVGFKGKVRFDSARPDGALRKLLDSRRLESLGWKPKTGFRPGLEAACRWYLEKQASPDKKVR